MQYENLRQLIQESSSSRRYFLSLPVDTQVMLHNQGDFIHTAAELHRQVDALETRRRQVQNSDFYFS